MIVTDPVVYMQNRKDGIEHEIKCTLDHTWSLDDGRYLTCSIEDLCKERRIRVKQKDIPQELAREAVELFKECDKYLSISGSASIGAEGPFHQDIKSLLSKLEESEQ